MDHGPSDITETFAYLHALDASRISAVLRLPESCPVVNVQHELGGITEACDI